MITPSLQTAAQVHAAVEEAARRAGCVDLSLAIERAGAPSPSHADRGFAEAAWVGHLRRISAKRLTACGLSALVDDAMLVISELVTNGFQHGAGTRLVFRLVISAELVLVEVDDGSSGRPRVREAEPDEEQGRGMFLVDALASAWGVSEDGRRTWAALDVRRAVGEMDERRAC